MRKRQGPIRVQHPGRRQTVIILASLAAFLLAGWYLTRPSSSPESTAAHQAEHALAAPTHSSNGVAIDAARVDLGHVPLNTDVTHVFRLTNEGAEPVRLGRATIQVLEGC